MKLPTGFLMALCVLLGTACARETEFYCCTDPAVCPEVVDCASRYPDRPFCDMGAQVTSTARLCQADPMIPDAGVECSVMEECSELDLSACLDNVCSTCVNDGHCERFTPTPHCLADQGCVACTENPHCTTAAPICDLGDHACRGCRGHDECGASGLCQDDGACVAGVDILHVDGEGPADGDCTAEKPCRTINAALALVDGSRKWIKVAGGVYPETLTIENQDVILVGPGAVLEPALNSVPVVIVREASKVRLEGLTLQKAGNTSGDGLKCVGNPPAIPSLELRAVTLGENGGQGLDALDCELVVERSTITTNAGGGLLCATASSPC